VTPPAVVVVTGASGVGKTTLVTALDRRGLPGIRCHYFDSIGVPSAEEMTRQFGSPSAWQEAMTRQWIARLGKPDAGVRVAVLDGQARPSFVRTAFAEAGVKGQIILIDCSHEVREDRLRGPRAQPDLASRDMAAWAAYLRGQADALGLPIVDTTSGSIEAATDALFDQIGALLT
jgi:dephospho-CoA kinase